MDFKNISTYQKFEHLESDLSKWPISKFTNTRKAFLKKLTKDVIGYFNTLPKDDMDQAIARTIYLEKQRVKSNPWNADPPNEMEYYRKIQNEYNENQLESDKYKANQDTLIRLIKRYGQEIIGHFNPKTFLTARKISDFVFHFLLYPFSWQSLINFKRMRRKNLESIKINGHCEEVRSLFKDHIIVLVPTHSSNLDSIMIGYTIDVALGMPAFAYGAGLNLFDSEFFAFFMNRLGAYKVDRRKKNVIYLQTLNSYSKLSILEGMNTIFFPGGTRSRSGEVETKVKLGLLGSLIQAQRSLIELGSEKKVVVVPVVLGYESVLEARSLVIQHLRTTGQEKYTARVFKDGFSAYLKFTKRILSNASRIVLTFGKPMDVFGNVFNEIGESIDSKAHVIRCADYFLTDGKLAVDSQREMIYTRELGEKIGLAYKKYNFILPAHLVAYVAFKLLSKMYAPMDVYSVVQVPEEEFAFPKQAFETLCLQVRKILFDKSQNNELIYPSELEGSIETIISIGIKSLGIFHINRILFIDDFGRMVSQDFLGLYFYANKMANLEIDELIDWASIQWEAERF
ncbi:MAG: 1-acyl-sn-glycerol-3-phosphate acyltransferase [Saprospiraceae bacterium]|nr:1-acyl-sn-glycerol-3-phosphate acyltransferase [Saprospiraceae bacterium]